MVLRYAESMNGVALAGSDWLHLQFAQAQRSVGSSVFACGSYLDNWQHTAILGLSQSWLDWLRSRYY